MSLSSFLPKSFGKQNVNTRQPVPEKKNNTTSKAKDEDAMGLEFTSFGKKRKPESQNQNTAKKQKVTPPPSPEAIKNKAQHINEERRNEVEEKQEKRDAEDSDSEDYPLPVSEMVIFNEHSGPVLSLNIDYSGSRLLSGSADFNLKFWDFAGMYSNYRSFRSIEPLEGHPVVSIKWNDSGSEFLVSTASLQPRLYDRDGHMKSEYQKGDQYIMDMTHTKGHVAAIYSVAWSPVDYDKFITASADSTVRIWDKTKTDKQLVTIKAKNQNNTRIQITHMNVSPYGANKPLIAAACLDGSIQLWPVEGNQRVPALLNRKAHSNGTETSSLLLSSDGHRLISRGGDDTMKVWDIRKFTEPVKVFDDLENAFMQTNICFSPDEKVFVTGTSVKPGSGQGKLLFFDSQTLRPVHEISVGDNSVIDLTWHPILNQIFTANGDGTIKVFYSPTLSQKGVLMGKDKDPKSKKQQGYTAENPIFNPHALSAFRPEPSMKRQKLKARKDPIKSRKPDLPLSGGVGHGGKVGSCLTQHLVRNMIIVDEAIKDPREALLKYADKSEKEPLFFGSAYKTTQPKTIFQAEEEDDD